MTAGLMAVGAGSGSDLAELLADLRSVGDAVRQKGWAAADLGAGDADLGQLNGEDSPLAPLSAAGFGSLRAMVSFLEEPLHQLAGDAGSVSGTASSARAAGNSLATMASSYRASSTAQTNQWKGSAAEGYRAFAAQRADGIAALGEAANTIGDVISGAGAAVAQTAQGIREDISDAVEQMLPIMTQAKAQAAATHGASVARAIPQCVQIAETYGQQIVARMRALLSSGLDLDALVNKLAHSVDAVKQVITGGGSTGQKPQDTTQAGSGSTSGQQSVTQSGTGSGSGSGSAGSSTATTDQGSSSGSAYGTDVAADAGSSAANSSGSGQDTSSSSGPTSLDGTTTTSAASVPATVTPVSADSSVPTWSSSSTGGVSGANVAAGFASNLVAGGRSGVADRTAALDRSTGTSRVTSASKGGVTGGLAGSAGGTRARGEDDKERLSPQWLRQDQGVFDADEPAAPEVIDTMPDDGAEYDFAPVRRPKFAAVEAEVVPEQAALEDETAPEEAVEPEPMTAEVLRLAAARKDAPPRLLRAADAVLEGKFTWEEAAAFESSHPFAQALFTPKAWESLWPILREVATQIGKENRSAPKPKSTEERQR